MYLYIYTHICICTGQNNGGLGRDKHWSDMIRIYFKKPAWPLVEGQMFLVAPAGRPPRWPPMSWGVRTMS